MMKQMIAPRRGHSFRRITLPALALLAALALPSAARAQWTTDGGSTVTTTPNSVGVGTANPAHGKLQVNKSVRIDDDTASTSGSDTINAAPSLYLGTAGGGGQLQYNAGGGLDLWQYNGTWRRTITFARTGWVGIGTTAPKNLFHVDGGGSSGGLTVSGWSAGVGLRDNGAGPDAKLYQWRSEGGLFRMALVNDAESAFVRQNILVADAAGNVGVGAAPSSASRLHVLGGNVESQYSTAAGQGYGLFVARDNNHFVENAYLDGSGGHWRAIQAGKSAMLSTNAAGGTALTVAADDTARAGGQERGYASLLTVRMDGRVGIGNPAPGYKLDVAGRVNGAEGLCMAGVCKSDWAEVGGVSQWSATTGTTGIYYGAGSLGVGTPSPAAKLSVTTASANDGILLSGGAHWSLFGANFGAGAYNGLTQAGDRGIVYGGAAAGAPGGGFVIAPWAGGTSGLRLDPGGKVGIGTAGPTSNLHLNVAGGGTPVGAMSIEVGSFQTDANALNSYYFRVRDLGAAVTPFYIRGDGHVGVGTTEPREKLEVAGNIHATGALTGATISATYQDVAEWVPSVQKLQAGTVVVLDTGRTNHVVASAGAYDTKVAGVVSAEPGVILGIAGDDKVKVATTGRVKVKVDATRGAIRVGDLLVTSEVEGVAMKSVAVDLGGVAIHRPGTIIGKALEPLESGVGEILVLLSLQ